MDFRYALPLVLLAAGLPVSAAPLASTNSTFSGVVPPVCQVSTPANPYSPLTYVNNTLTGQTNAFSFESNGNVALQLRSVDVLAAPDGTYYWNAGLKVNNGATLATADAQAGSQPVPYPNGLTANDDFQMTLAVSAPQGVLMRQGTYTAVVTTDCVIRTDS